MGIVRAICAGGGEKNIGGGAQWSGIGWEGWILGGFNKKGEGIGCFGKKTILVENKVLVVAITINKEALGINNQNAIEYRRKQRLRLYYQQVLGEHRRT